MIGTLRTGENYLPPASPATPAPAGAQPSSRARPRPAAMVLTAVIVVAAVVLAARDAHAAPVTERCDPTPAGATERGDSMVHESWIMDYPAGGRETAGCSRTRRG